MMRLRIIIILFSILTFSIKAQQAYFSSLNQNLLSINPAFAGTNDKLRVQAITGRTGWPKYGADNMSYYAGADFLAGKHHGFGLSFNSNIYTNSGVFKSTQAALKEMQIDLSYALHLKINDKIKIVPAFQVSYFQITMNRAYAGWDYSYNNSRIEWGGTELLVPSTKRNVDFSSGLLLYGKRFYAGATVLSFTQPDEGVLGVSKRMLTQIYQGKYRFGNLEGLNVDAYSFVKAQKFNRNTIAENFVQYGTYLNYKALSIHLANQLNEVSDYNAIIIGIALNGNGFKMGCNTKCNYSTHLSNTYFYDLYLQYSFGRNKKEEISAIKLID